MSTTAPSVSALCRVCREVRVTARGMRLAVASRARGSFARRVMARYTTCTVSGLGSEMVLRRQARWELRQTTIDRRQSVRIAPMGTVNMMAASPLPAGITRHERMTERVLTRIVMPERRIERTLVKRLLEREVRREAGAPASARELPQRSPRPAAMQQLGLPPATTPVALPVRRAFRRAAAPTARAEQVGAAPSRRAPAAETAHLPPPRSSHARLTEPISPVDLTRITDHVLETIDRKMTASRERRGKR